MKPGTDNERAAVSGRKCASVKPLWSVIINITYWFSLAPLWEALPSHYMSKKLYSCKWTAVPSDVGGVSSLCWDQCRYSKQSLYRRHQCDRCLRSEHKHLKATETWTGRAGAAAWLLVSFIITRVDKSRSTNTTVRNTAVKAEVLIQLLYLVWAKKYWLRNALRVRK